MGQDDTINQEAGPLLETLDIGIDFAMEAVRKGENPPEKPALTLEKYRNICHELVTDNMLTPELLNSRVKYLQETNLTKHLESGHKLCLTVLPFSPQGMPLSQEDISNGLHLKILVLNSSGKVVQGFGMHPSFIAHLLPEEVTREAFDIEDPANNAQIIEQFKQAYGKLQNTLGVSN